MKSKNILHLNAYYIDNPMYSTLFNELDNTYNQKVYIPIKWDREARFNVDLKHGEIIFSNIIKPYHKYLYFNKINRLYNDSISHFDIKYIDLIHAHSIFADGGVAYKLHKKFNIDYVITVRQTDIALQYKYMLHRRSFANKILLNAKKIIFVSDIYRDMLYSYIPKDIVNKIIDKTIILPNGVNNIYLEQTSNKTPLRDNLPLKLLYIGRLVKYKNLLNVIAATKKLRQKMDVELTIIGGASQSEIEYSEKVVNSITGIDYITYISETYDRALLLNEFSKNHIFICPSKNELFGVVYIEAMSQNTPFIYGQNAGVEPFVKGLEFCEKVDGTNVDSIEEGVIRLKERYNYIGDFAEKAKGFSWDKIITQLSKIYNE